MSFFGDLWDHVTSFFSKVQDFLAPFEKQFMTQAGPIVLAAAEQAVEVLAASAFTSAQKRDEAFKQITNDLKKQGISVGTSIINGAIEAAVAKLKAAQAEPLAAVSADAPTGDAT